MRRDRRGIAAMEFALVAPLMTAIIIGVFDVTKAMILNQEVYNAAHDIALMATIWSVQPDKTTTLTQAQVQQALSEIYAEMPSVRSGIDAGTRSVTLSSVGFFPVVSGCTPSATKVCTYYPSVVWSVSYSGGNAAGFTSVTRACGAVSQVLPATWSQSNLTTLPTSGIVDPDPVLVVDVHYQYTPLFFTFVTGAVDFYSSSLLPVRSIAPSVPLLQQYTTYDLANAGGGSGKCTAPSS